jgi:hypothetical protein
MATVTLLAKAYNDEQLRFIGKHLKSVFKDLNVEAKVLSVTSRGWVQIAVDGEDEKVALRYLTEEFGLCPVSLENLEKYSVIKGRMTTLSKSRNEVCVDIGVFSPKTVDAVIPLHDLQAKLVDGRKTALTKMAELYGLHENLPLSVKVDKIDGDGGYVEAFLSEKQCKQYEDWAKSMLDRLIVLGASRFEVEFALKRASCNRDVIAVESLGMFEQAAVCKFGTDARGLIPKIGKKLQKAVFVVFCSKEAMKVADC